MNAFPDSTGDGLKFRVIGEDTSIDPATGEIAVPTEALRDGIEIIVTAGISGGEASSRFRLTVAAEPMTSAPALVTAPSLAGSGLVGEALSVDAGTWAGEPLPEIALQWRCGGADLPGATAASYLPGAAEDGKPVTCRVTATNASGSLSAETAELIVTRPAPVLAGGLADVSYVQGSGPQGVDAGGAFAGGGLVFAVEGGGAVIDPATGQVTLPTDALRDGETVRVTASNSGGAAEVSFAVTVAAKIPAFPAPVPDSLWRSREVRDEAPAGRRRIDVDAGVIVPAGFTLIWLSGRTSDADLRYYTPVAPGKTETTKGGFPVGTTLHDMIYWRRDEDGAFSPAFVTKTQYVVQGLYPKPVLVAPIADRTAVQGDPAIVLDASLAFYPDGGKDGATFSVTGAAASIDAATGVVTITTAALRSDDPVTVTATTVSGSAEGVFKVSIIAKTAPFPPDVADAKWTDGEERDAAPEGRMKVLVAGDVAIPGGFTLCWSPTTDPNGVPEWSAPQTPGTSYTTNSTSNIGTTIHSMLFWRRDEGGAYQLASGKRTHVVQGLRIAPPPPRGLPIVPAATMTKVRNSGVFRVTNNDSSAGGRSPTSDGMTPVVAAVRVMAGGASTADTNHLKAQVDASLEGSKCPLYQGGYTMQHDLNLTAMWGVVRNIPEIWDDHLTAAQRNKATALMKSAILIGAWSSSDNQGNSKIFELPGYEGRSFQRNWNPNYRLAFIGQILAAIPFFGSAAAVQDYLDSYTTTIHNAHVTTLSSLGLTNNWKVFNAVGSGGKSPSKATFVDKVSGYSYYTHKLTDNNAIFNIVKGEADNQWSKPISFGHNGVGVLYNGTRRGWVVNASGNPPNKGDIAMAKELDITDGGASCNNFKSGPRSAMSYALDGARCEINYIAALAATGFLSRGTPGMAALMTRMSKGWGDMQDKTDRGFLSYSKGMCGPGGRENWTGTYPESTYLFSVAAAFYDEFIKVLLT